MASKSLILQNLEKQHSTIKDRIRGVVGGYSNGMYLHGRPGSSKSYLVRTTLKEQSVPHHYHTGHITPGGLFNVIAENAKGIIVLDDVTEIFKQPVALQVFLAALGNPSDGTRVRRVLLKNANEEQVVGFEGGIIAISNLSLSGQHSSVVNALNDRIHVIAYDPSDEEIEAQVLHLASRSPRGVDAEDAKMVAKFLLAATQKVGQRPSIRLFMDKALPDFKLWKDGRSESSWKDLVRSSVQQQILPLTEPRRDVSRKDRVEAERRVALEIYNSTPTHDERIAAWKERIGASASSFNRRIRELREDRKLTDIDSGSAA
jgi:hypothetical protein